MSKQKLTFILLIVILFIGFFLRFYKLGQIPPGPEWDEASVGYNAYSIAQTGKDEWGTKWPLIFPAFGDYKNPLYIYLTAAVVRLFGLNIVTTRFINALTGALLILVWFFIADLIFRNRKISLLTAFFLAVSPFGIFYSRIAGDGIMLSVFLIGLGIMAELYYLKNKRLIFFIFSVIFLILSMFSYNLARIVSPVLLIAVLFINFISVKTKKSFILIPLLLCSFSFFLLFKQSKMSVSSRLQYVGIFGEKKGVVLQINEFRDHDKNSLISKIVHNKVTFFAVTLAGNYISYFSSDYLVNFKEQSGVSESHYPPLHLIFIPFYYLGFILLIGKVAAGQPRSKRWSYLILLLLILFAPLPGAITEGQSTKRDLASLGSWEILTAGGLFYAANIIRQPKRRSVFLAVFVIIFLFNLYSYIKFLIVTYPRDYGYLYARRENKICDVIKTDYNRYDYFIFSRKIDGVPYIFPLFCLRFSPDRYWQTRQSTQSEGWFRINSFDKFIIVDESNEKNLARLDLKNKHIALFLNGDERNELIKLDPLSLPILPDKKNLLYLFSLQK